MIREPPLLTAVGQGRGTACIPAALPAWGQGRGEKLGVGANEGGRCAAAGSIYGASETLNQIRDLL